MMGKDARYVPGWDCHGLPIEWKIEEQYRKKGKNKDDVPVDRAASRSAASLLRAGSIFSVKSSNGWAFRATGKTRI